ncbi:9636_t:CDS:2 [Paraglomus occultum]|uniref:Galactokinase n=1 Tax=Paraglomus occultum TaxID=144539 RepID=A0A9N8WPM9_9GLOM|nr:9636_t:CDS:2 [Paraglomus occultum]
MAAALPLSEFIRAYPEHNRQSQYTRYHELVERFRLTYNREPKFIARAPGRVNLIGEHIDYVGFGVLPMAISGDILIAVSVDDDSSTVRIKNVDDSKYKSREWQYEGDEQIVTITNDEGSVEWSNYFKCGYKGIIQHFKLSRPKGLHCLVDGNVPPGAGLSSSSAFVCCAAIAVSYANNIETDKTTMAKIAIECERYIGVNGGGMDQTTSIFAATNQALYISFRPTLRPTLIKLPSLSPPLTFVVSNSLVTSNKAATAQTNYNLRVVETKLAAYYLGTVIMQKDCDTLWDVASQYVNGKEIDSKSLRKLAGVVEEKIGNKERGYGIVELTELLSLTTKQVTERFLTKFPVRTENFHLYKRAKHVFEEAARVLEFYSLCQTHNDESMAGHIKADQVYSELGQLMNSSHDSCRDLYDCSCVEVDELVRVCLECGAKGSRLTGAGWGGCVVSVIPGNESEEFISKVTEKYYNVRFPDLPKERLSEVIFETLPGAGAAIITSLR